MPCQAKPRASYKIAGWTCTGDDLVSVMRFTALASDGPVDIVCPRVALEIVMSREFAMGYDVRDFAGGDHYHLCLTPAESADLEYVTH
jgi:hypothetical protein